MSTTNYKQYALQVLHQSQTQHKLIQSDNHNIQPTIMSETSKKSNLKEFFVNSNPRSPADDEKLHHKKQRHLGPAPSLGKNIAQGNGLSILIDLEKKITTKAWHTKKEVERNFNPDDALLECEHFLHLHQSNKTILLPPEEEYEKLNAAQNQLRELHKKILDHLTSLLRL